jgi:hypothetical protein
MSLPEATSRQSVDDGTHREQERDPQIPEEAHIKPHKSKHGHKKKHSIENELSDAMQSSLMPITSIARDTSPTAEPGSFLYATAGSGLTRPVNLALAPRSRRRASSRLQYQRQRSLSFGSTVDDLALEDPDPFAWLRQTVQEQRQQAIESEHDVPLSSSMPASPLAAAHLASSPVSLLPDTSGNPQNKPDAKTDYFGAGLLSLVAGKGPVKEHLHVENDASAATIATPPRFSFPSLPNMPSMPNFQAPQMPSFKAPDFSSFKAPSASTFMPDSLARLVGANQGEGESKKFMDEADQANSDEPDWARIKVSHEYMIQFSRADL